MGVKFWLFLLPHNKTQFWCPGKKDSNVYWVTKVMWFISYIILYILHHLKYILSYLKENIIDLLILISWHFIVESSLFLLHDQDTKFLEIV